jgi:uncharacterized protein (TIGR03435 family)
MCRFPRRSAASGLLVLATVVAAAAAVAQERQTPAGTAAFDVASVKRYQPAPDRRQTNAISVMPGGRFTAPSATLPGLIAAAYGILAVQIVDAARPLPSERFEIEARTSPNVTVDEARAMLRRLLAERFGLSAHREMRQLPVYLMTIAREDRRLGENLRPSGPDCAPVKGPIGVPAPPPPPGGPPPAVGPVLTLTAAPLRCLSLAFSSTVGSHLSMRELPLARFAEQLIAALGRPVLDRTGLDGPYDIDITYTPDAQVVDASDAPNAPSLVTAIREQLGLRLEATRAQVEVLVIDAIAPPTEN